MTSNILTGIPSRASIEDFKRYLKEAGLQDFSGEVEEALFKLHLAHPYGLRSEMELHIISILERLEFASKSFNEAQITEKESILEEPL